MQQDSNHGDTHSTTTATRRHVLQAAGAGSAMGALATLFSTGVAARNVDPEPTSGRDGVFDVEATDSDVYPQSVASGGPTPAGAIVWTRVAEDAYLEDEPVGLQVTAAPDRTTPNEAADFSSETQHFRVPAAAVSPEDDLTLNVDLDSELDSDRFYFYRFVYDGAASPVGRLRTLPEPEAEPDRLKLAVASCNRYQHGYFGGFAHMAREDADYLVHLGDFIYEYGGDGSQPNRGIELPSGKGVAHTLEDYRYLNKTYRSDELLQSALRRHTLVHTWDDHEIVNNNWWNYETGAPETQSHPNGDDPEKMRELYAQAITALTEYLPFRVEYDPDAEALHDRFRLYRSFRFGQLAEIAMADNRFYRSAPPEDEFGQRDTATPPASEVDDPDRTMLGADQREWLIDTVTNTPATWKVWGDSVLNAGFKATNVGDDASFYINYDAWDGYEYERQLIMGECERAADARGQALNLVTLTGDMHAYLAAYTKTDYKELQKQSPFPGSEDARVGVEFMCPGVTSDDLSAGTPTPPELDEIAVEAAVESQNPHVEWFNWSRHGYTTVEFTDDEAVYNAYEVDRTDDSADADRRLLRSYRVPEGEVKIEELVGSPTDVTSLGVEPTSRSSRGETTKVGDDE